MAELVLLLAVGLMVIAIALAFAILGMMAFVSTRRLGKALRSAEQRIAELEGSLSRLESLPRWTDAAAEPARPAPTAEQLQRTAPALTQRPPTEAEPPAQAEPQAPPPPPKPEADAAPPPRPPRPPRATPEPAKPEAPPRPPVPLDVWASWGGAAVFAVMGFVLLRGPATDLIRLTATFGLLVAAVLVAAGQWLAVRARAPEAERLKAGLGLVAAGLGVGYATVVIGRVGFDAFTPLGAHWLLAAVGLGATALSARHGVWMAAGGLAAGLAAPALTGADMGPPLILFGLLFAQLAAAFGAAERWGRPLLAWAAAVGGLVWAFHWVAVAELAGGAGHVGAGFLLALAGLGAVFGWRVADTDRPMANELVLGGTLICAGAAALMLRLLIAPGGVAAGSAGLLALAAGGVAVAAYRRGYSAAAGLACVAATIGLIAWQGPADALGARDVLIRAGALLAIVSLGGWLMLTRPGGSRIGPAVAAFGPLVVLAALEVRLGASSPGWVWPAAALVLAAVNGALALRLPAMRTEDGATAPSPLPGPAAFALATASALVLAAHYMAPGVWSAAAMAAGAAGLAWRHTIQPSRALQIGIGAFAAIGAARLGPWLEPLTADVGPTPLVNMLVPVFAVAAGGLAGAAHLLRRAGREPLLADGLTAGAVAMGGFFLSWQLRHAAGGGVLNAPYQDLIEAAGHSLIWLIVAAAVAQTRPAPRSILAGFGLGAAGFACVHALWACGVWLAPWWGVAPARVSGGPLLNDITLAYALPAAAFAAAAFGAAKTARPLMARGLGGTAILLALMYLALALRYAHLGPAIGQAGPGGEGWLVTLAWVALAAGLLTAGRMSRSPALQLASLAVGLGALVKAFLFDFAAGNAVLTGVAVLALGGCAYGLVRLYQRYVFDRSGAPIVSDRPIDPNLIPPR